METCPFSGLPCFEPKCHQIIDVKNNKMINQTSLCDGCGLRYVEAMFQPREKKAIPAVTPEGEVKIPISILGPIQAAPIIITTAADLMKLFEGKGISVTREPEKEPCPSCGQTIHEWNREGKFGCKHCYVHFYDEFIALAGPFQDGQDFHYGKRPKRWVEHLPVDEKRKVLRLRMARAVETENYEEAARLKVQIDSLSDECSSPPQTCEDQ